MYPFATCLAKLGSRFGLVLDAPNRRVRHSALGRFLDDDVPTELALGLRVGRTAYSVPLTRRADPFPWCEQHLSMTSVRYVGTAPDLGLRLTAELRSPFYPRDKRLSLAPFFYVTLSVEPLVKGFHWRFPRGKAPKRGEMFLELVRPGARRKKGKGGGLWFEYAVPPLKPRAFGEGPSERRIPKRRRPFRAREAVVPLDRGAEVRGWTLRKPFRLPLTRPVSAAFLWAAFVDDPAVLDCEGCPAAFEYTRHFSGLEAVVAFGRRHRERILGRTLFFDYLFEECSLSKAQKDLIAFSFQHFLANTWWVRRADGRDWFSVWEGVCRYHSTVDVEYNAALAYFALWPELLEKTLRQWSPYAKDAGDGAAWMAHDVGGDLFVGRQIYDHEMEVEENADFLLMLHALWRWTGKDALLTRHATLVRRLVAFLERADTTGDGVPDRGVANTIDDASAAVQYAREQTYLAVKTLAALEMAADMADARRDPADARRLRRRARKIQRTLDRRAWLGDHYAVCLERTTEGLVDVRTGRPLPKGELDGWDACSIYTANGTVYPALVGRETCLDPRRLRTDLATAADEALRPFGCTHSSADRSNIWVSQNLWRDFAAAYLGVDLLDMADRYFAFQLWDNQHPNAPGFVDTYGWNNLCHYPRGITSIGLLFAALGFSLDRKEGVVRLSPLRAPQRLPLLALADWPRMRVPWCEVSLDAGRVRVDIQGPLPKGLKVVVEA